MHATSQMAVLLLLVATTVVGPLLASKLRLPAAVVLILSGVVVGPTGFGWVRDTRTVSFVSDLGFLILMFIAGMEIDFTALRTAGARTLVAPVRTCVGFFLVAALVARWLHLSVVQLLVISATSVGMPLAVLQETGQSRTALGRQVMLMASIGEFLSILALTGYEVSARVGLGWPLVVQLGQLAALFAVSALAIRWSRALVWWYPDFLARTVASHETAEIGVRTGLLLMLTFVVFVRLFHVEAILGAFIAGMLVSFVLREKSALEAKIAALGHGLFIPIFFVVVGVRFQPGELDARAVRDAGVMVAATAMVKVVPTLLLASGELSWRDRLAAGLLLAAPLTLVVAIGAVGQQLGVVAPRQVAAIVLVALILSVIFPVLFRRVLGVAAAPAAASGRGHGHG